MCDLFSGIVRVDGEFRHIKENSHSGAVAAAGWQENNGLRTRFVEAEWNGVGKYPGADEICRGELNEKQRKTIDRIYGALASLVEDPAKHAERMLFGKGIFVSEEYADLRWLILIHEKCPSKIAKRLCDTTLFISKGYHPKNVLPKWLKKIDGGYLNLSGYTHALPAGFTHCGGDLNLSGYTHALPAGFTHCGGDLNLSGYTHALPAGFKHCGGDLNLSGYTHALPAGFTHCGGDLYLRDYTHALPAGFKQNHKPS
jgi:hypothetical protein